ncbi:MAG: tyrosine-type recombinase/integrase [Oscillospiraceae bacterium]|nr:tyrosine-type recombinase/integrase [Oscillospiraceae bacterium]
MGRKLDERAAAALQRLLAEHPDDAVGTMLRLAWDAGLTREEIVALTWDQVDPDAMLLRLPDREVPLDAESAQMLRARRARYAKQDEHVLLSDRRGVPLAPPSVSRLARTALTGAGLEGVSLQDLRTDFIRRQLAEHDWPYVLRITGLSVTTYRNIFAGETPRRAPETSEYDRAGEEYRLWRLMHKRGETSAAIALWLARQEGLRAGEIAALTWEQVDFAHGELRLAGRSVPLTASVRRVLEAQRQKTQLGDDPHVLLTPRTRRAMTGAQLSALVRTALIRAGIEGETLDSLRRAAAQEGANRRLSEYALNRGSITRGEAARLLTVTPQQAHDRLAALCAAGTLVRVGAKYYPAAHAVAPEKQAETIRAYLTENGAAYRQDLAQLLGLGARVTARLLKSMVARGELALLRTKQYTLPAMVEKDAEESGNVTIK